MGIQINCVVVEPWDSEGDSKTMTILVETVRHRGVTIQVDAEHEIEPDGFVSPKEASKAFDAEEDDELSFEVTEEWADLVDLI